MSFDSRRDRIDADGHEISTGQDVLGPARARRTHPVLADQGQAPGKLNRDFGLAVPDCLELDDVNDTPGRGTPLVLGNA
jgi:hypothetical protein